MCICVSVVGGYVHMNTGAQKSPEEEIEFKLLSLSLLVSVPGLESSPLQEY